MPNPANARQPLSWRKRLLFASIAAGVVVLLMFSAILSADLYVHHRAERNAGVNIWGYRGPRVPRKAAGEHRLVVLGGSTAFGYGVDWEKAFPAQLEADLRPRSRNGAPVTVVNLGMNSQGRTAFRYTLEDYLNLQYDAAIFYEGYNDLGDAPNEYVGRRDSPVFRLFGYYPILHIAIQEKAMALRTGGDINSAYAGKKTVFKPGLGARTSADALDAAGAISRSLTEQLGRLSKTPPAATSFANVHVANLGCSELYAYYCASVHDAVKFALDHQKKVLVVTQPYINPSHRAQQRDMRAMLAAQFGGNPAVGYVDLGDLISLPNPALAYDGMHLNADGNRMVGEALVRPIALLMPDAFNPPPSPGTSAP